MSNHYLHFTFKYDTLCFMHIIQKQLLDLIATHEDLGSSSLRKIAEMIGAKDKPQTAKYHLQQLEKDGLIQMNLEEGVIKLVKKGYNIASILPACCGSCKLRTCCYICRTEYQPVPQSIIIFASEKQKKSVRNHC